MRIKFKGRGGEDKRRYNVKSFAFAPGETKDIPDEVAEQLLADQPKLFSKAGGKGKTKASETEGTGTEE